MDVIAAEDKEEKGSERGSELFPIAATMTVRMRRSGSQRRQTDGLAAGMAGACPMVGVCPVPPSIAARPGTWAILLAIVAFACNSRYAGEKTLDGKLLTTDTALVTGAAFGIGRGIASAIAREGARVLMSDLDAQRGESP